MRKDFLLFENDLLIKDGDFVIGESDLQHIEHIIASQRGGYKQFPLIGVGINQYINSPIDGILRREIQLQLQADGYGLQQIKVDSQTINIRI